MVSPLNYSYLESCLTNNFQNLLKVSYLNFDVVLGRVIMQTLIMMLETWKESNDNNKTFGMLSTDLLKVFDCLKLLECC